MNGNVSPCGKLVANSLARMLLTWVKLKIQPVILAPEEMTAFHDRFLSGRGRLCQWMLTGLIEVEREA